ncbi:MAG TPA: glycosyltransferase family 4 protein [Thermoanaerobaculia bacterium]|nr:glycosyltransferase family 4 protein [Thermoanaerobaculia bacterium]
MLRVVHVSPTYFAPESVLGGGERFAEELARAMAGCPGVTEVKLVSFGPRAFRERPAPRFERVILRSWSDARKVPFSPRLARELEGADVVHCHQYFSLSTFLAAFLGRLRGSRVFVSDLGGGGWTPGYQIDQSRWITAHLPISEYAARELPGRRKEHRVIYGGVDLGRYPMREDLVHDGSLVFLGRVLPHKGVHFLIEGLPPGISLHVVGPQPDAAYLDRLRSLAAGKAVTFHGALPDEEVQAILGRAMALVHPTPVDARGSAGVHELFGLALVEAMARGCPVIASDAASLPEIVTPEENGLLVPPNQPAAIGEAVLRLAREPELWARLAVGARRTVEEKFTWERVAARCLEAYEARRGDGQ